MRYPALLFPLLLLSSFAIAVPCESSVGMLVPAVVGNGGGLVNVTMSLQDGDGSIYTTIDPRLGLMTQDSIDHAVGYARRLSEDDRACDVIVRFEPMEGAGYIDGPSAGSALTVMAYALFSNESFRSDTIITGGIGPQGEVVPVGGLYEKAKGAVSDGRIRYFITPTESLYEMLLLDSLEDAYGIGILEAESIDEIIGFMSHDQMISEKNLSVRLREAPDIGPYTGSNVPSFALVASRMVDLERERLSGLKRGSEPYDGIHAFFENELSRQEAIIGKGYYFTAANEAFLDYIEIETIIGVVENDIDLPRTRGQSGICLSSMTVPAMGEDNYEWVIGADQRIGWAMDKIDGSEGDEETLSDERYSQYNDLMYAKAWCMVAQSLVASTPEQGAPIDESVWAGISASYLERAYEAGTTSEETATRLRIAEKADREGSYGRAIYDSAYVAAMEETVDDVLVPEEDLRESALFMLSDERDSLWGKVYQSQGAFLLDQNQTVSAYKVLTLARNLDEADALMREAVDEAKGEAQKKASLEEEALGYLMLLLTLVSMFLLGAVVTVLFKGMKDGSIGKGARKASRIAEEEGGIGIQEGRPGDGAGRGTKRAKNRDSGDREKSGRSGNQPGAPLRERAR